LLLDNYLQLVNKPNFAGFQMVFFVLTQFLSSYHKQIKIKTAFLLTINTFLSNWSIQQKNDRRKGL